MANVEGESAAARWQHARNVLCIRLDTIGDVLMTTPALRALKSSVAGRRLTLLTSQAGAAVAPLVPEIDDVITYEAPWVKSAVSGRREREMADLLRGRAFDASVIFTVYTQSALPAALLCRLAGIPRQLAHCRENPYALLSDWVRESEPDQQLRHEAQRQLDLVAAVGCATADLTLSLRVPDDALRRVRGLLAARGIDVAHPWCVLHPGATATSRRYPAESFGAAADELVAGDGWQVVVTGTAGEAPIVEAVQRAMRAPSLSLCGVVDLAEMAALLSLAPLLISNNSGPVHIAAAVGTPVVDLYALTNPQHTPWRAPARVLSRDVPCRWCYRRICPEGHHHCLRLVEPAEVAAAARELYAGTWGARHEVEVRA